LIGRRGKIGEISQEDFTQGKTYSSDLFLGSDVILKVVAENEPKNLSFRLAEIAFETDAGAPLSVTDPGDQRIETRELSIEDPRRESGRSVGKLVYRSEDGRTYLCTGFLISPNQLLTNEHCINSTYRCSTALAIFGFFHSTGQTEQARCAKIIVKDKSLDFSLIELDRPAGNNWGFLTLATNVPVTPQKLYIPQHPDGRIQETSIEGCRMIQPLVQGVDRNTDFSHSCDTEGGASGSPTIDETTNEVVGLHHWGFESSSESFRDVNRAVRIDEIRRCIEVGSSR